MTAILTKDTLELIQDTAKKSQEMKLMQLPNDPEQHLLIGNGTHQLITTKYHEKPRKHVVESIADFAAAYHRWYLDGEDVARAIATPETGDTEVAEEQPAPTIVDQIRTPNVWLDLPNWRLIFFVDEPLRRAWVKLKLTPSPQWLTLEKFRNAVNLKQPGLVRLLRHDLRGCVDAAVLLAFRTVSFEKMQNARRQIESQQQRMDADLTARVAGEKKPEEIFARVPVLASRELAFAVRVELSIDIDVENETFTLQAMPGDLDLALEEARAEIRSKVESELRQLGLDKVTILCGNPAGGKHDDVGE